MGDVDVVADPDVMVPGKESQLVAGSRSGCEEAVRKLWKPKRPVLCQKPRDGLNTRNGRVIAQ